MFLFALFTNWMNGYKKLLNAHTITFDYIRTSILYMAELEYWLRGPVPGIPGLLQPVAHALLQAESEIHNALSGFPAENLWKKPAGVASVGFHLQHIPGVIDRLFSYANQKELTESQKEYLNEEGKENNEKSIHDLLSHLEKTIQSAIEELKLIDETILLEQRGVGRKKIPSNVLGLLFHAAEHAQRHVGQLLVTAKIVILHS